MSLNFVGYPVGTAIGGTLAATGPELALAAGLVFGLVSILSLYLFVPR